MDNNPNWYGWGGPKIFREKLIATYHALANVVESRIIREEVPFYNTKDGIEELDEISQEAGAPSKSNFIRKALIFYLTILKNREPGEHVTVYIGDDKKYPADKYFDFKKKTAKKTPAKVVDITDFMK